MVIIFLLIPTRSTMLPINRYGLTLIGIDYHLLMHRCFKATDQEWSLIQINRIGVISAQIESKGPSNCSRICCIYLASVHGGIEASVLIIYSWAGLPIIALKQMLR